MVDDKYNGYYKCPIETDWRQHRSEARVAMEQIGDLHLSMETILKHTAHLSKLDCLERMETHFIDAATGRDQIPTKTVHVLIGVLGTVMVVLVLCIAFLLTGESFGWIRNLH